jgi:hypothetical protein
MKKKLKQLIKTQNELSEIVDNLVLTISIGIKEPKLAIYVPGPKLALEYIRCVERSVLDSDVIISESLKENHVLFTSKDLLKLKGVKFDLQSKTAQFKNGDEDPHQIDFV